MTGRVVIEVTVPIADTPTRFRRASSLASVCTVDDETSLSIRFSHTHHALCTVCERGSTSNDTPVNCTEAHVSHRALAPVTALLSPGSLVAV